ncbi:MAG: lipid-A-disaccharide synthase [Fibrobacteres bacterium]|nr:lipid-A-disaccharide synthase [Fibrobacterota bacterium]
MTKKIFFSTGEKSAENHVLALKSSLGNDYELEALAGDNLKQHGFKTLRTLEETSVLGFTEVIRQYPRLRRMLKESCSYIADTHPDLLVLVDYPGFNIPLGKFAKKIGIKTLYYIAPKTWAWGEWRAKKLHRSTDKMAVIFPFEEKYFKSFGIDAVYVGNPNAEAMNITVGSAVPGTLGILPGSRKQEIGRLLPQCIDAAKSLLEKGYFSRVIVSQSDNLSSEIIEKYLPDNRFSIVNGSSKVYSDASFLFVKSGTATLEAALSMKPFISMYKVSPISGFIIKSVVKIPNVTMINIMLDKTVVPELMQENVTPAKLISETENLLQNPHKIESMLNEFRNLKENIEKYRPSEKVAEIIKEMTNG